MLDAIEQSIVCEVCLRPFSKNKSLKIHSLDDLEFLKIQLYKLAALALSFGAHIWLVHTFAVGSDAQDAQKPDLGTPSGMLTVQLIRSGSIPNSQETLLAKSDSPDLESALSRRTKPEDAPILPDQPPPAPYYFRSSELTSPPQLLQDVRATQNLDLSGMPAKLAVLRLLVGESGDIDRVVVEESSLPVESTRILVEKFSRMKFNPGKIDNLPVKSQLTIEVEVAPSE